LLFTKKNKYYKFTLIERINFPMNCPSKEDSGMKKILLILLMYVLPTQASMYPPDHQWSRHCQSSKHVDVCQIHTMSGYQLQVIYHGYLMKEHWGDISVFVKLNGQEATLKMHNKNFSEFALAGTSMRNCKYCPPNSECSTSDSIRNEVDGDWICEKPTKQEITLFYWAVDEKGLLNKWDVELAF
jgi:hypothetical protein